MITYFIYIINTEYWNKIIIHDTIIIFIYIDIIIIVTVIYIYVCVCLVTCYVWEFYYVSYLCAYF